MVGFFGNKMEALTLAINLSIIFFSSFSAVNSDFFLQGHGIQKNSEWQV